MRTVVYTDGACSGNPGPGGWGWVVPDGEGAYGGAAETTNQRMELTAVLEAVRALEGPLHIVSDSTYVVNCFRDSWWQGWLARDWKNSQKKPVANRDLWEPLIELYQQRDLTFEWVKGHSGDRWNERADDLAVRGRDEAVSGVPQPGSTSSDEPGEVDGGGDTGTSALGTRRIAVVGHRPPEIGGYRSNPTADGIRRDIRHVLEAKASMYDDVLVLTGLQLGAETLAAEAAIEAGVGFIAVLAFPDPSARWPGPAQKHFDELIDRAADVVVLDRTVPGSPAQVAKSFQRRDRWLQREADEAIVIWDGRHKAVEKQLRSFEAVFDADVWVLGP